DRLKVIGPGRVGYLSSAGFETATSAGTQTVYTAAALGWTNDCQMVQRDIAIASSGVVALLPGCSHAAVQRGTADGAALGVLHQPTPDTVQGEHYACAAADPGGGFYFIVTDIVNQDDPRLVHLPEGATAATVPTPVPTVPSLGEISYASGNSLFGPFET